MLLYGILSMVSFHQNQSFCSPVHVVGRVRRAICQRKKFEHLFLHILGKSFLESKLKKYLKAFFSCTRRLNSDNRFHFLAKRQNAAQQQRTHLLHPSSSSNLFRNQDFFRRNFIQKLANYKSRDSSKS